MPGRLELMTGHDACLSLLRAAQATLLASTSLVLMLLLHSGAHAFVIELKGVAPDRIERQRAQSVRPHRLPGAPDPATLDARLETAGAELGDRIFIRLFKAESLLELWIQKERGERFSLFATYPICFWSGQLGPKLREGDRQTPEGFYTVSRRQLHRYGTRPRSLNLGFPNRFDRLHSRTGSYILVHGGCSSIGCYSMTDEVMAEIYKLARTALYKGQRRIHVHAFPFRMTADNMRRYADPRFDPFWQDLKAAHDVFEASRLPPEIAVCRKRYVARAAKPSDDGDPGAIKRINPARTAADGEGWPCWPDESAGPQASDSVGAPLNNPG